MYTRIAQLERNCIRKSEYPVRDFDAQRRWNKDGNGRLPILVHGHIGSNLMSSSFYFNFDPLINLVVKYGASF
jgi:hypothetical protein